MHLSAPDLAGVGAADLAEVLRAPLATRTPRLMPPGPRRAAVLLLLHDVDGTAHLLLTKRSDTLALHRGQVSLPGGGWEPEDADLAVTALRETEEEVGVPAGEVDLLGRIDDVETRVTSYVVAPYVGLLTGAARPYAKDPVEVARVMHVPVAEVLEIDARIPLDAGVATLRYPLDGEDVWGATARILRDFAVVIRTALGAVPDPG